MMKLEQITRPLIAYSLCFDDVMKTFLSAHGIAYDKAFSACWEFQYERGKNFSEAVTFPHDGYKKYECIGIDIKKIKIDGEGMLPNVIDQIKTGKVVPIHYDGYYCPWDKIQIQKDHRWHNLHTVLAYAADDQAECFYIDDPFYNVCGKTVPYASFGTASKFYLSIDTTGYKQKTYAQLQSEGMESFLKMPMFEQMEQFLFDFEDHIRKGNYDGIFDAEWVKTIEQGYMTRHYLWLFYRSLYRETGKAEHGKAALLFYIDLQAWKECVTQSHKGWRRCNKQGRSELFARSFSRVIESEKHIAEVLINGCNDCEEIISETIPPQTARSLPLLLNTLLNARGCKQFRRERKSADITGEGEYILPEKKYLKKVHAGNIEYPVLFGEERDHIRCEGQKLEIPRGNHCGIAFLICSEWGRSLFSAVFHGRKKLYYCDSILNDFTNPEWNSVRIGVSCLVGKKRDKVFQKNIYLQSLYFSFPKDDIIEEIILPDCISVHLFSAVLVDE